MEVKIIINVNIYKYNYETQKPPDFCRKSLIELERAYISNNSCTIYIISINHISISIFSKKSTKKCLAKSFMLHEFVPIEVWRFITVIISQQR